MTTPRLLAEGLGFTEGPLWTTDGRLLVTSASRGRIYAIAADGSAGVLAEPGGGPTGLALRADGTVWIAQGGAHGEQHSGPPAAPGIQQIAADGSVRQPVAEHVVAPNDCAFGPDARLWFTDPVLPAFDPERAGGALRALDPCSGDMEVIAEGIRYPNGLVFALDGDSLYVAATATAQILRLELSDGDVSAPSPFADLDGASPDGLAIDAEGRLHVAAPRADVVLVLDLAGAVVEEIAMPSRSFPTNLCFGGPGMTELYITAASGGRVFVVDREIPGATLFS